MSDTTTTTELERLRADLEVLERYAEGPRRVYTTKDAVFCIREDIARLETEQADPWREAKLFITETTSECDTALLRGYVDHLTAENADLKHKYDLANSTIKTATERLAEEKAEKERLAKRVEELEAKIKAEDDADIADAQAALSKYMEDECKAGYAKSEKALAEMVQMNQDMGLYEAAGTPMVDDGDVPNSWPPGKPLPDMQPPFEGPIVGLEPILDPSRVLATAAEVVDLLNMDGIGYLIRHQMRHLNPKAYPVRKNPDGSPQFQRKGAENGG